MTHNSKQSPLISFLYYCTSLVSLYSLWNPLPILYFLFLQPENGLQSVTFYTEDAEGYREAIWTLNQKMADSWQLGQVLLSRDYDFLVNILLLTPYNKTENHLQG